MGWIEHTVVTTWFEEVNLVNILLSVEIQSRDFSFQCAAGVAYETPCTPGLSYDAENHICNYPDNVYDCKDQSESVVGFKCPTPDELPPNAVARR